MEIDTSTNDILREVVTFLECLGDAQLPLTLENLREKLLARSKNTLSVTTRVTLREASSPEPYLDMKSGPKSLLLTRNEAQANLEEYVGMEESQKHPRTSSRPHSQQDYYETFENKNQAVENASPAAAAADDDDDDDDDNDDDGQTLIGIYKNLPAMQIRSKCHKCGPLYRKEGKKLFLSESLNACWIALVGSHLLIYRSERHNRPYAIYPIRGYMARPAPTMILRSSDRRKSDAAFEIYSPGNETLQLIARTPKDMEQWIAKICEVGCSNHNQSKAEDHFEEEEEEKKKKKKKKRRAVVEGRRSPMCRDANDEAAAVVAKSTVKAKSMSNNNKRKIGRKDAGGRAPPLPARIPRRLPSLPPASPFAILSYEETVDDNDDNDDIYHRIEDLRNEQRYQNMVLSKEERADPDADDEKRQEEAVAYDDVRARLEETRSLEEMYDDVVALSRINATSFESERNRANDASVDDGEQGEEEFYDDVENLIANSRFARDGIKDPSQVSNKLEKKSFLGKVLSRRDSPGKSDTHKRPRSKSKVWSNSSLAFDSTMVESQVPTYDDVSDLTPSQKEEVSTDVSGGEDLPEYNCPPPPRPIYQVKSPAESQSPEQTGEFYDDVSAYQERRNKNQPNHHHHHQQVTLRAPRVDTRARANEVGHDRATCNADSETNGDSTTCRDEEDTEHYQSPRSAEMGEKEQLYDDIALWADFTARQRDRVGKKESEDAKSVSSEKKAWNRFAVNRKSRATSELNCSTAETTTTTATTKRDGNEGGDEIEASSESNGAMKKNTFQKLISRMENSLAKVSARSPSSLSTGKPSASSNSS